VKKNVPQKFTLVIFLLLFMSSGVFAQMHFNSHRGGGIWRHWYVQGSVGTNAFFGDISTYDHDPFNKLKYESKFGYSFSAGKWINEWGGAHFTFSGGALKGTRNNYESNANFYQYTVEGVVNITQLINKWDMQSLFYIYAKVGFGLIEFNALYTNINSGDTINIIGKHSPFGKRVTEWVIPIGFGGVYNIDDNFGVFFDATLNYTHTDKLDAKYKNGTDDNNDYYIYASVGVKYTFTIKDQHGKYKRPVSRRKIRWVR